MDFKQRFNGEFYDIGTGTSISLNEIKNMVSEKHNVNFINAPERKGDVKITKADINKLKNIGWCAKIDSKQAIYDCF